MGPLVPKSRLSGSDRFLLDPGSRVTPQLPFKVDLPGYRLTCASRPAALGQLRECERAKDQLSQLIALRPDTAQSVRLGLGTWYQSDLVEPRIEGLRKAPNGE